MRTLRWAAELAVSDDAARAKLGIAQLGALGASDLLEPDERLFVDAALESVYGDALPEALSAYEVVTDSVGGPEETTDSDEDVN